MVMRCVCGCKVAAASLVLLDKCLEQRVKLSGAMTTSRVLMHVSLCRVCCSFAAYGLIALVDDFLVRQAAEPNLPQPLCQNKCSALVPHVLSRW